MAVALGLRTKAAARAPAPMRTEREYRSSGTPPGSQDPRDRRVAIASGKRAGGTLKAITRMAGTARSRSARALGGEDAENLHLRGDTAWLPRTRNSDVAGAGRIAVRYASQGHGGLAAASLHGR
jgi:hypothetical protein